MKKFDKKILAYIEVLLVVFTLILFLSAHYLHTIAVQTDTVAVHWMGMDFDDNLFTDIALYSAIFLTTIIIILNLDRIYNLKKKKKGKRRR